MTVKAGAAAEDLAEVPLADQHPVLQRLTTGVAVGDGVRAGAAWALGARVGAQAAQFLGTIVTARLLTPSQYGVTAVIFPVLSFGYIFTTLGVGSSVIHARRLTERLLSTAFWWNVGTGLALTGLVAGLSVPLSHLFGIPQLVPLMCLASLIFTVSLGQVQTALLERTLRWKQIAVIETAGALLGTSTTIVAAVLGAGSYALVLGPLTTQAFLTAAVWTLVGWRPATGPNREDAGALWTFTRGITGFQLLNFWARNADNLLLARFVSLRQLGFYSRSYNLMQLPVWQMNTMMSRVLFPALTRLRDDRPRLGQAWLRALSTAGSVVAPVTLGLAVAAPALVEVLYGRRWLGMVPVLELLAVSALPQTLTTTVAGLLRSTGATDTLFRLGLVTSSISLLAILVGLPWGVVGVAAALMVKFYVEVLISLPVCFRQLGLGWRDLGRAMRGVWLSCLALAGWGLVVRLLMSGRAPAWQVLLVQVAACGAAYVGTMWLVDRGPLLTAWSVLGRLRRRPAGAKQPH